VIDAKINPARDASSTDARGALFPFVPCGCQRGPGFHWYCVNTEFHQEVLALQQLRTLGFCTWLPQEAPKDSPIRPLFARYLFVQFDRADDGWREIYSRRGVVTILGTSSGRPACMPAGALESLWEQCHPNGVIYPDPVETSPAVPALVVRRAKPLPTGFEHITQWSASSRLAILLRTLNGEVPPARDPVRRKAALAA
jgi:hypothetical protein